MGKGVRGEGVGGPEAELFQVPPRPDYSKSP